MFAANVLVLSVGRCNRQAFRRKRFTDDSDNDASQRNPDVQDNQRLVRLRWTPRSGVALVMSLDISPVPASLVEQSSVINQLCHLRLKCTSILFLSGHVRLEFMSSVSCIKWAAAFTSISLKTRERERTTATQSVGIRLCVIG